MIRLVKPELLDEMPADHPLAVGSRRDLRRLNRQMRSSLLLTRTLRQVFPAPGPRSVVELGAGDGTLLLDVARQLGPDWRGTEATLLDQQDLLDPQTREGFEQIGWRVRVERSDLFHWLEQPAPEGGYDLILANLFLHHFTEAPLRDVFAKVAPRTRVFLALEPRRCLRFMLVTRLLWLYGCNRVTRHDAQVSVRAGFNHTELSSCWPNRPEWSIVEGRAGWFSHQFLARQRAISEA
jgi:hypothetical protein